MLGPRFRKLYKVQETIGEGSYGIVVKVQNVETNEIEAVKTIDLYSNSTSRRNEDGIKMDVIEEMSTAIRLGQLHPNIVKYYDFETFSAGNKPNSPNKMAISMEFCSEGNLFDYQEKHFGPMITEEYKTFMGEGGVTSKKSNSYSDQMIQYLWDMVEGIKFLHDNHIIHRDMKPENVLLTDDGCAKIADFGLTLRADGFRQGTIKGTKMYLAPEIVCESDYVTYAIDSWALGIIMCEIFFDLHIPDAASIVDYINLYKNVLSFERNLPEGMKDYVDDRITSNSFDTFKRKYVSSIACKARINEISSNSNKAFFPFLFGEENLESLAHTLELYQFIYGKKQFAYIVRLIKQLLQMDPEKRISIHEMRNSPLFDSVERLNVPEPYHLILDDHVKEHLIHYNFIRNKILGNLIKDYERAGSYLDEQTLYGLKRLPLMQYTATIHDRLLYIVSEDYHQRIVFDDRKKSECVCFILALKLLDGELDHVYNLISRETHIPEPELIQSELSILNFLRFDLDGIFDMIGGYGAIDKLMKTFTGGDPIREDDDLVDPRTKDVQLRAFLSSSLMNQDKQHKENYPNHTINTLIQILSYSLHHNISRSMLINGIFLHQHDKQGPLSSIVTRNECVLLYRILQFDTRNEATEWLEWCYKQSSVTPIPRPQLDRVLQLLEQHTYSINQQVELLLPLISPLALKITPEQLSMSAS